METQKITIKQSENCKYFKDVYINGQCVGSVMADDKMTPYECYEDLKNNWSIDSLECENDINIDNQSTY